jgi:hypothetical protein
MDSKLRPLTILNLTGQLSAEMISYFKRKNITIIDPFFTEEVHEWTHILTKDINDFGLINKTYKTLEKDVRIISLSYLDDLQKFLFSNGKLIFDEVWMKTPLGPFILDKFFQGYGGVVIGDSYPSFKELGSFNIANPFNTGEYLDRMVHHAFNNGMSGLMVKTFFDHLLMFLTGLKTKGKLGLPIEVSYGIFDNVFGIQLNFFTDKLMMEDVTSCLSSNISKRPEDYILNVAVQSSDFFDFTFLNDVKKAVITGLWTPDERIKYENRGLMFTNLSANAQLAQLQSEQVTSDLADKTVLQDFSDKIILPEMSQDSEAVRHISGEKFNESLAEKISSSMELEKVRQIVSGKFEDDILNEIIGGIKAEEESPQVVKGSSEDDLKIKIGSQDSMDELVNHVKGKVDEDKSSYRIPGSNKIDIDKFAFTVSSGLDDKINGDGVLKSRIVKQQFPDSVKKGLFDFASRVGKSADSLSDNDLLAFKNFEIPKLLKLHTDLSVNKLSSLSREGQQTARSFFEGFKNDLEKSLKSEFHVDALDDLLENIKDNKEAEKIKTVLKDSLKRSLEDKFHLSEKNELSDKEQNVLVKTLTTGLKEEEEKIREIVTNEKRENAINQVAPLFPPELSANEKNLENKIEHLSAENEMLKSKLKTVMNEVKVVKESKNQLLDIQSKATQLAAAKMEKEESITDSDKEAREQLKKKLSDPKSLTTQDTQKLSSLIERESKLQEMAKQEEIKAKKILLESAQKDAIFSQELEKYQRQLKSRDAVLENTKTSLTNMVNKKVFEINSLQQKLDQANKMLANNNTQGLINQIREMERQNANNQKMMEMYKNKISSLAANMQKQTVKADEGGSKEEVRKLSMLNNQMKNQLEDIARELSRFQLKATQDQTAINTLRSEKSKLEQELKKAQYESTKPDSMMLNQQREQEFKRVEAQAILMETQLREAQSKAREYEAKLQETMKNQKKDVVQDDNSKVKVNQLEASLKKLTHDLVESRSQMAEMKKDTNKLRQEKTALQNQLDRMKKIMDKNQAALPKKPGAGGKAA